MAIETRNCTLPFNSRGVTCHPEQIIIGSSTEQLINLVTDILNKPQFYIENPSYPPIKKY